MDGPPAEKSYQFGYWAKESEDILRTQFPLHRCCRDGDVQTLSLLLLEGQSGIYSEDSFYGWTPAHWASYFGKLGCLRKLMAVTRVGVDCDINTSRFRQTPTHVAAYGGHPNLLHWLLLSGANVSAQDYLGETPLHKAARTGSIECISLLISHGAKLDIKNNNGHTASCLALTCGYQQCSQFITEAMKRQEFLMAPPQSCNPEFCLTATDDRRPNPSLNCVVRQGLNGGMIPPSVDPPATTNGQSDNGDCEMDTIDASEPSSHHQNGTNGFGVHHNGTNGFGMHQNGTNGFGVHQNGTNGFGVHCNGTNGAGDAAMAASRDFSSTPSLNGAGDSDILLTDGVRHNQVPIAGRKRTREDINDGYFKRIRTGGLGADHHNNTGEETSWSASSHENSMEMAISQCHACSGFVAIDSRGYVDDDTMDEDSPLVQSCASILAMSLEPLRPYNDIPVSPAGRGMVVVV